MKREPRAVLVSTGHVLHPRAHHLLAAALADDGFDVVEVGFGRPRLAPTRVRVLAYGEPANRFVRLLKGPLMLLRSYWLRPDILHVASLELLPWAVVGRLLTRVPTVYDSREDYAAYAGLASWLPPWIRPIVSQLVGVVEPWLAQYLDAVTTADEGTAGIFRDRVSTSVIHNFPRRCVALAEPDELPPKHDVIYHGTLSDSYLKQIAAVGDILAQSGRRIRWCVATLQMPQRKRSELNAVAERLRQRAGTVFTIFHDIPHEDVPRLLLESRLGLIPLPNEPKFQRNIPMKLFELLAVGRPVVVSDLPPIRRFVDDLCCMFVAPGDSVGYATAIAALIDDPARAEAMGRHGRQLVLDRLNAEEELRHYTKLCRRLSNRGGSF